jgi:hypothetical protein
MKNILAMLFMVPALAAAQDLTRITQDIACVDSKALTELVGEFRELPYVRGISRSLDERESTRSLVIFVNPTTGSFTIAEKRAENLYCVLAIGDKFEPVPKKLQDELKQQQDKATL